MRDQDGIGEAEVYGQSDDGRHELSPERADEVGHIAEEPNEKESERNSIGGALLVVLNKLRKLFARSWVSKMYVRPN